MLIDFKDEDFDNKIKNENVSVIQFSAAWCGPCKALKPVMDKLAVEYKDKAGFYYADIEEGVAIQVRAGGSTRKFMMNPMLHTVLSAGQAAGFELPYSCKAGMCCTCRCLLVSGEVEMDANYSLEPWEIEAGFILSCQARAKTKTLIVDFDNL